MDNVPQARQDQSLGELLKELTQEITTLVRQELNLAKAEMRQKASRVGKDVGMIAVGGFVAYVGLLALVAALIIGLAYAGMPWWASALLVGVVLAAAGGVLVWQGINALKAEDLAPRETIDSIESFKEDVNGSTVRRRAA